MTLVPQLSEIQEAAPFGPELANERGVCLAEFTVALATGVIVLAAALQTFIMLHAETIKQQRRLIQQQEIRLGLEVFEQEVRFATPDLVGIASPQELRFQANINSHRTTLTGPVTSGQSTLPVLDGSGWGRNKTVMLCAEQTCEFHGLLSEGLQHQLVLAEPVQSTFPMEGSVEVINRVGYYTKRGEHNVLQLMRMVDGGANVLIADLEDVKLSYWDEEGRPAVVPSTMKRVVIELKSSFLPQRIVREVSLRS